MNLSKVFRSLLLLSIVLAGAAILWSFLSRRQEAVDLPQVSILPPDVSRQSTEFQYTEHKGGKTIFAVYAETSTQTVSQVHTLQNVTFTYYDEGEEPSDQISAEEAVYRIADKQIEFNGDANIQLVDGTEVFSDQVLADLVQEVAVIEGNFRFKKGNIEGSGASLIYRLPIRELQVNRGLDLVSQSASGPIEGNAQRGVYWLREGKISLAREAFIGGGETNLKANDIVIHLTPESRIEKILSSGQPQLQSTDSKLLSGNHINVALDPASGRFDSIEVLSKPPPTTERAAYSEQLPGRSYFLEADRIVVSPNPRGTPQSLVLERFSAQGNVQFRSPSLGIEQADSNQMEGQFFQDGEDLRQLDLQGNVSVMRRPDTRGSAEEKLRSQALKLRFGSAQEIEQAQATGNVDLRLDAAQGYRHLTARESVDVSYLQGAPQRILSRGQSRMERVGPNGKNILNASLIDIRYRQGLLDRMMAQGGVTLESNERGKERFTSSQQLEVFYRDNEIERAVQSGDFHFWEGKPATIDLRSKQAVYDPKNQSVTMTGDNPMLKLMDEKGDPDSSPMETMAESFQVDPETGEVSASGRVRSFFREEDAPIVITAGRMEADPETGWIDYFAGPRIVQQSNSITGDRVSYNHQEQQLVVKENVKSSLIQESPTQEKTYRVQADHLAYKRAELRARYEGNVQISTEDLTVDAPFVDLVFSSTDQNQLKEIVAWGGVHITQGARSAEGDQAVHDPIEEKVVLTGDPAQVVESNQDTVTGRQLTFFLEDERLLIENPETP